MSDFDDDAEWDDDDDADCHAGAGRNLVEAWQRCGMAGTEYCDWECKFARQARAQMWEQQEKRKAKRRSHTADMLTTASKGQP